MNKPYSEADFSNQITQDRTWRLKEISDIKSAVRRADPELQRVLLRALITVCYAHWEGYVRFVARRYLEYVALRKFSFNELDPQFFRNFFLPRLAALSTSKTSLKQRCDLIEEILSSSDRRFSRPNEDLVNTKANLNFDVLTEICLVCNIPVADFMVYETFIDVLLLKRRNSIAHGEDTFVSIDDLDDLTNKTIEIMRAFGTAIENHVALKAYRGSSAGSATVSQASLV